MLSSESWTGGGGRKLSGTQPSVSISALSWTRTVSARATDHFCWEAVLSPISDKMLKDRFSLMPEVTE